MTALEEIPGLTGDEFAEIARCWAVMQQVFSEAARRELAGRLPAARRRLEDAVQAARDAVEALAPAQAAMEALDGELAECQRRAAAIKEAMTDDDLTVRVEARSLANAFMEELADLARRGQAQRQVFTPLVAVNGEAARELEAAKAEVADLEAAVADPFTTETGKGTSGWVWRQLYCGLWWDSPKEPVSVAIAAMAAERAGLDKKAEARGALTLLAAQRLDALAGLPVRHQPDSTPASEITDAAFAGAGAVHQTSVGFPGHGGQAA